MLRLAAGLALLAAAAATIWWAASSPPPSIAFSDVRATPVAGAPQSVMVTFAMDNRGGPDRLVAVSADGPELAMVKSVAPEGLPVPGEGPSQLSGEAGHVMLMGLKTAPGPGDLLPFELTFERAGTVALKARVADGRMDHGTTLEIPADGTEPSLALQVAPDGDGWRIALELARFRLAPDLVDQPHRPGTGHAHLYVGGTKIGRLFEREARIGPLPPGRHTVLVTLNSNDHRALVAGGTPIAASVEIEAP